MRKIIITIATVGALAGCTSTERGAVAGGAIGAGVAVASGASTGTAVAAGAGGAVAGALIGRAYGNKCRYRDRRGRTYIANC